MPRESEKYFSTRISIVGWQFGLLTLNWNREIYHLNDFVNLSMIKWFAKMKMIQINDNQSNDSLQDRYSWNHKIVLGNIIKSKSIGDSRKKVYKSLSRSHYHELGYELDHYILLNETEIISISNLSIIIYMQLYSEITKLIRVLLEII